MTQTLMLILRCLAHIVLLMLNTYYYWIAWNPLFLDCSTSTIPGLLDTIYGSTLTKVLAQHALCTWHL